MNSTELIEHFNKRKAELDNPDDWDWFMEGYFSGINDSDMKNKVIEKAWEFICEHYVVGIEYDDFIKYIEEEE